MKHLEITSLILLAAALTGCNGNSTSCRESNDSAIFTLEQNSTTSLLMFGTIDCTTNKKLQDKIQNNPIDTLIMASVPGSEDDEANIAMAKTISGQNLTTIVPENGLIASGGVDLFLAGTVRKIEPNVIIGVHSWATGEGTQGIDVYNKNPGHTFHQLYIDFYDQYVQGLKDGRPSNDIANIATDFYVYTLQAAPAKELHCMTAQELVDWGIVTDTTDASTLSTVTLGQNALCTR